MRKTIASVGASAMVASGLLGFGPASPANAAALPTDYCNTKLPDGTWGPTPGPFDANKLNIGDITFSDLRARFKINNNQQIPTFADYLALAKAKNVGIVPEIKNWRSRAGTIGPELSDYATQILKANFPDDKVIIGSFDATVLQWFKDHPATKNWERIWFRGAGPNLDAGIDQPLAPATPNEMFSDPVVVGDFQKGGAPAATAIGLINIGWYSGLVNNSAIGNPAPGQSPLNFPAMFTKSDTNPFFNSDNFNKPRKDVPVNIWYNTLTGGDSPDGAAIDPNGLVGGALAAAGLPPKSPGWTEIVDGPAGLDQIPQVGPFMVRPANTPKWLSTDETAKYKAWKADRVANSKYVPLMIAHRGGGSESVTENTLQAYNEAAANGADFIETDVQWTKPLGTDRIGTAVLMHDISLNRTMKCRQAPAVPKVPTATMGANGTAVVKAAVTQAKDDADYPTSVTITSTPGARACSYNPASATQCTITGLVGSTKYTFTAKATNSRGASANSAATAAAAAVGAAQALQPAACATLPTSMVRSKTYKILASTACTTKNGGKLTLTVTGATLSLGTSVTTTARAATVKVTLKAPGVAGFAPYTLTKTYTVK